MHKDFAGWHIQKTTINNLEHAQYFREGEVCWTAIGHNVGHEEDGKGAKYARPVLIIRKFNQMLFFGVPISSTNRSGRYYHPVQIDESHSKVLLSHLREFDSRRLINKIATLSNEEVAATKQRLRSLLR